MEMEEDSIDPHDVERAKTFWARENVDQVFLGVLEYLHHLKGVLKKNTATDREYVQGLKLLEALDCCPPAPSSDSVVQVVIGSDELLLPDSHHSPPSSPSPSSNGTSSSALPPSSREELLPPLTPVLLQYQPHSCCKACLSDLPSMHRVMPPFWGQNPLKVPLLCGFKRLTAMPLTTSGRSEDFDEEEFSNLSSEDLEGLDVIYKAPCGQSLRNPDDVLHFLVATGGCDLLQVDFFTFNPCVQLDRPRSARPKWPAMDLSRGTEATPVELCRGEDGARPAEFRYRKDRWPHGCFLSRGPTLFKSCCDCTDGCSDAQRCSCVAMTKGGRHYTHHRLEEPVPTGVYECGPWCGCDRARCQNRLVQRGIRVRLQIFQTGNRGWGVRCRDDLDRGTFVCIYAGVILRRVQSTTKPPSPKMARADMPSDDEVEVVTEWLAPPAVEGRSNQHPPTSSPLHVPVIQRSPDANAAPTTPKDREKTVLVGGPEAPPSSAGQSGDQPPAPKRTTDTTATKPAVVAADQAVNGTKTETKSLKSLKRAMKVEELNFLDASKEGNVSRFINHSCQPNLFIQNVFTDSHDPAFPLIAFFTNSVVKAGTELMWNYSADTQRNQEVPCLCGSNGCQGEFMIENLCDVCEGEGKTQ